MLELEPVLQDVVPPGRRGDGRAAIHLDRRAGDIVGARRGEEQAGMRDILRRSRPPDRHRRTVGGETLLAEHRLGAIARDEARSEEHTSEFQSLMRISYAVFCLT